MKPPAFVLLGEDSCLDVELTLDAFRKAHLVATVQVAPNGQAAFDYLFGRGQCTDRQLYPLPNLVLLDLKLPGIDRSSPARDQGDTSA